LECVAAQKFHLVVTDYKMPRMDGLELISRLRKQSPGLPLILISGFVDALGLNEQNTGADTVIQKSNHEVTHLVRAVARLLNRKPAKKPPSGEARPAKAKKKSSER
jgi:CheY-like chemotaxis protein